MDNTVCPLQYYKKLVSRGDSERELFNDDIVHVLQNTIGSRMNSATDPRSSSQPEPSINTKKKR